MTDDPETLEQGHIEFNTTYTLDLSPRDHHSGRTWEHEAPLLDFNYGLTEAVQLNWEMPISVIDSAGEGVSAGVGDASAGAKIRLVREDEWIVGISTFPAVGVPIGNRHEGLGTGCASLTIPVQIGQHVLDDQLFVYADGGYVEQFARGERDFWYTGLAAEYTVNDDVTLYAEVRWELGVRGAPDDSYFNVGLRCALTEHAAFIGAIGRSFNPSPDSGADLRVFAGIQWTF